jgi:prepilin-type N-terminal cleavage/methylation domain-containing protein
MPLHLPVPMRRGFTLLELAIVLSLAGFVLALSLRPMRRALDHFAADGAARDITTVLAITRQTAVVHGRRARLRITAESLTVDTLGRAGWGRHRVWLGPADRGVGVTASNPVVVFAPTGLAWGVSNTSITLVRGSHVETVIVSRAGRVRRG